MKQVIITFAAPSGGAGKSTISREVAIASSLTDINGDHIRTCLVDANMHFGSQAHFFKLRPKYNITDLVSECSRLHERMSFSAIDEYYGNWGNIEKYLTYIPEYHLYLLPEENRPSVTEGPDRFAVHDGILTQPEVAVCVYDIEVQILAVHGYSSLIISRATARDAPVPPSALRMSA